MSADTVSELQKALEQERAARQRADDVATSWAERGQEAESRALHATARAEQAERERDEAREYEEAARNHTRFVETEWAKRFDEVDAARERAEAALKKERARLSEVLEQVRQAFAARNAPTPGDGLAGILAGVEELADRTERAETEVARLRQQRDEDARTVRAALDAQMESEADNATLSARLQAVCNAAMVTDWAGANGEREARFPWDEIEFALRDLHVKHPGAALLERLLAAEEVVEAVRRMTGSDETMRMVTAAMVVYDPLKGAP